MLQLTERRAEPRFLPASVGHFIGRARSVALAIGEALVLARELQHLARRPNGIERCRQRLALDDARRQSAA